MAYDTRFGPSAQTQTQRARALTQKRDAVPSLKTALTAFGQQLFTRCVASELSWLEVPAAHHTT